ncbi:peptidase_S8 domain-containing protein, partial [Haematococcus lacustris]
GLSHPSLLPWPTQGLPTRAPAPASSSQPAPSSTPGLDILWLVNGSFAPAAAALLEWQQPLQGVARHCKVELLLEHGSLLVAACPLDVEAVLGWLAAQPSVRWLSPRMQMVLHNRMAGAIVQSGSLLPGQDAASIAKHPLWQ